MSIRSGFVLAAVLLSAAPLGRAAEQEPPQSPNQPPPGGEVIPSPTTPQSLSHLEPIIDEVVVEAAQPRYVAPTLRDSIGRIWAPVFINGKGPFRLVLDTGATRSALLPRVARALQIPMQAATMRVHGVTGSTDVSTVDVHQLEVGDLLMKSTRLPIVPDVFGGADGVLGNEALGDKRIFIDFRKDRIEISTSHSQRPGVGMSKIPLKLTRGLLSFQTNIGSVATTAVIDTGAQRTIGNQALRTALNRRQRNWEQEEIIGVTLDVEKGDSIPTPAIKFGRATISGVRVTFTDTAIFDHWGLTKEPALLLGMDVLGLLDVLVIDYKTQELHVRFRGPSLDTHRLRDTIIKD
ncbi:MAG TPA: retropepsin-like aspartic protease [Steroidobacteraceae bacterium]|jgi:predicted aspartyl protease|nr:retropepsin-like aspartic protease [Steroidobacteraceae bacterium]